MDAETSGEVSDASAPLQPEMEAISEAVSKLEISEESAELEKPPALDEKTDHTPPKVRYSDDVDLKETEDDVLTGAVTLSGEEKEMETEDLSPTEKSEMESVPGVVAPPQPDESSEKIFDAAAASDAEPGNIQPEQQPLVLPREPEPSIARTPLAESAPEPVPEKAAEESDPEADPQEQTSPEPAMLQPPVDAEPPSGEEKEAEQEVTAAESHTATEAERDAGEELTENVAAAPMKEEGRDKPSLGESVSVSPEKPAEEEASADMETAQPAEGEREAEPEKSVEPDGKEAEAAPGRVGVKSDDAVPAPGSLAFALLEQEQTRDALRASRTLIILRGLPGSGKSFLAGAIADAYKDQCSVICADDHGVEPQNPGSSVDGYEALDRAVVARCGAGAASSPLVVVVDDTNHAQDRLARLGEIAEEHRLVAVFLEPRTEWRRDVAQLTKKSRRGLEEAQVEAMRGQLEDMSLPLFFGWFLLSSVQDKVRCTSMDFLKTLDTLDAFKKHSIDFIGKAETEVDLEQYFESKGTLHCTTKFCNYGKAKGAKEYAQNPAVTDSYGSVSELSLTALFVTPRTVGARVSLAEEQLPLWPSDAETEAQPAVPLPPGSRAHVTLGCAAGVEPVQTGVDLLDILALQQQEGHRGQPVEEMGLGSLAYYGEGRWLLGLREPIGVPACFSSFYGPKEAELTAREPAKKKKEKCVIL